MAVERATRPPLRPVLRWLLIAAGWLCFGLGVAGVVLPILPTTPFMLLAAACFARSSDRFYTWLIENPHFGPLIRQWRTTRSIPLRAKRSAQLLLLVTFATTITFAVSDNRVRIGLAVVGTLVFIHVSRLRVRDPSASPVFEQVLPRVAEDVDVADDADELVGPAVDDRDGADFVLDHRVDDGGQ